MKRLSLLVLVSFLTLALTSEGAGPPSASKVLTLPPSGESENGTDPTDSSTQSKEPSYVPGQIIVKFKSEISEGVAQGAFDQQGSHFRRISGTSSLDDLLSKHQARGIKPLFNEQNKSVYHEKRSPQDLHQKIKDKFPQRARRIPEGVTPPAVQDYFIVDLGEGVDAQKAASEFGGDPSVLGAWPDYLIKTEALPNDTYADPDQNGTWSTGAWGQSFEDMWALKKVVPNPSVWDLAEGTNVIVAVIDTGLDYNHEDIVGNVWVNSDDPVGDIPDSCDRVNHPEIALADDDCNGYIDDVMGFDFINNDSDPMDDEGHGTHVAGTIAAVGRNGKGIIGVAYKSKIMPLKALGLTSGEGSSVAGIRALEYAADNGADVINNSWGLGSQFTSYPPLEDAIRYAYSRGCVVIFSAGNQPDTADVMYSTPKNMREVITVASADRDDKKAVSSAYGSRIDVAAPGGGPTEGGIYESKRNILSLKAAGGIIDPQLVVPAGGKYYRNSGTSMAAPHVSGLAALILSYRPTLTPEEVRHLIRSTADDITDPCTAGDTSCTGTGLDGFDIYTGYGRINATAALQVPVGTKAVAKITYPRYQNVTGVMSIKGIATADPFSSYTLRYSDNVHPPTGDPSWLIVDRHSTPVDTEGPLTGFPIDISGMPKGEHTLSLLVETGTGFKARDDILFNIPWPFKSYGKILSSPAVADLDGDGTLEILVGSYDGKLYCLRTNGSEKWSFATGAAIDSSPAIADLDGDGTLEVLVGSKDYGFYCLNSDGTKRWVYSANGPIENSPVVADMDRNGTPEILFTSTHNLDPAKNKLYCLNTDGSLNWSYPASGTIGQIKSSPAVADVDTSSFGLEVLFGSYDGKVYCLRYNGTEDWTYLTGGAIESSPAIADLDGNGTLEVLVGSNDGKLYALTSTGGDYWASPFQAGSPIPSSPAVADLNQDGSLEILFGTANGKLYALTSTGTQYWASPFSTGGTQIKSSPAVADLEGDGTLEALFGAYNNKLYCLRSDGTQRWAFQAPVIPGVNGYGIYSSPALADLDGDGDVEVLFGSQNERVYCLDKDGVAFTPPATTGSNISRVPWPMFRHDPKHSGLYHSILHVPGDYSTIQAAINAAKRGDTVRVHAGTYNENLTLKVGVGLIGDGVSSTIVDGGSGFYAMKLTGNGIPATNLIQGFTIRKSSDTNYYGIQISGATGATNVAIKNNIITKSPTAIYCKDSNSLLIENNTIVNNNIAGIEIGSSMSSVTIKNNIISSNNGGPLVFGIYCPQGTPVSISYNDVFYTSGAEYSGCASPGTGDISVDPWYVNPAAGDYHLKNTSNAIDAGNPASDYSKEPEDNGDRINMGAYGNTPEAEINRPPVFTSFQTMSFTVGIQKSYTISASDPEGTTVSFTAPASQPIPSGSTLTNNGNNTATFTWRPMVLLNGNLVVEISDGPHKVQEARAFTVSPNLPPVADLISAATPQGIAKAITLSGSDPEGQPLTYSIVTPPDPTKGNLSGTPPNVTFTPTAGFSGTTTFTFKVNDGAQDSGTTKAAKVFTNRWQPFQSITLKAGTNYDISFWTKKGYLPTLGAADYFDSATRCEESKYLTYPCAFVASDSWQSYSKTFYSGACPLNPCPSNTWSTSLNFVLTGEQLPPQYYNYIDTIVLKEAGTSTNLLTNGTFEGGTTGWTMDANMLVTEGTVSITVLSTNTTTPTLTQTPAGSTFNVATGSSFSMAFNANDTNGAESVTIREVSGSMPPELKQQVGFINPGNPANVAYSDFDATLNRFLTLNTPGSYTFTRRAVDSGGTPLRYTDKTVTINVASNAAPTFIAPSGSTATAYVNSPYSITFGASDINFGQNVTLSTVSKPVWLTAGSQVGTNPATITFSGTPTTKTSYTLTVRAIDNGNPALTATPDKTVTINVTDPPAPSGSCPYIHVFNGKEFIEDNDLIPAGSPIEYIDYYALSVNPKRIDGTYRLKIVEPLEEHSYLDQLVLYRVDHPQEVKVAPDPQGNFLSYVDPKAPLTAIDRHGEEHLSKIATIGEGNYHGKVGDELLINFGPLTDRSNGARLLFRTDLTTTKPPGSLKSIHVDLLSRHGKWREVEILHPHANWDMWVVDLTEYLRHVNGELKVRLRWPQEHKLDYIALDTSAQVPLKVTKLPLLSARHSRLGDVRSLLSKSDNQYAVTLLDDTIDLTFSAFKAARGKSSTFILQTEGNYMADELLVDPVNTRHRLLPKDLKAGNRGFLYRNPVPEF